MVAYEYAATSVSHTLAVIQAAISLAGSEAYRARICSARDSAVRVESLCRGRRIGSCLVPTAGRFTGAAAPSWYIGTGAVAPTVWNHLHGCPPDHGLCDVVYIHGCGGQCCPRSRFDTTEGARIWGGVLTDDLTKISALAG
jgi:hypothetical protein